jgi:undecaprenyl-diphosphatase
VLGIATTLALTGRQRLAADVAGVGMVAWNVAQVNKTRVRRQRPYEQDGVRRLIRKPTGSSFPSGHAAVGVAVFTLLGDAGRGSLSRRLLHAFGGYVALSRIYVGVHYPTDVLGGAGMGLMAASLWRGPVAAVNAAAVGAATAVGRRILPPLLAIAGRVVFGVRRRQRPTPAVAASAA